MADWILVIASQKWSEPRETRYVELFVVTDSKEVPGAGAGRRGDAGWVRGRGAQGGCRVGGAGGMWGWGGCGAPGCP